MFYKKNRFRKIFLAFLLSTSLLFFLFSLSSVALGSDSLGTGFVENEIALSGSDPRSLASRIINISLSILGIVAVGIVIFAGFQWMTAEGNEEKIAKAKGILKAGIIGLVIVLSAWGIASFVLRQLGDATGVSQVSCISGDLKSCGCGGVSACSDGIWGPCIGSSCLPGSHGSSCTSGLGGPGVCSPDNSLCNSNLTCSINSCTCVYPGEGDPCGNTTGGVCSPNDNDCSNPNLFCSPNNCTCVTEVVEVDNYAELGDPCNDGASCSAVNDICNPSHGLTCDSSSCSCVGSPVITGISPVGGFCDNNPNIPCLNNDVCGGGICNFSTPNTSPGNLITISGYNFDFYEIGGSQVNLIRSSDDFSVVAQVPGDINAACGSSWSNTQIIAVVPFSAPFSFNDELEVEVVTRTGQSDKSGDQSGPDLSLVKVNTINRPGLCGISDPEAKMNDEVWYYGINLNNSQAYFGNAINNILGFSPNSFNNDFSGVTMVPNLSDGKTNTFAQKSLVVSNFLDFKKLSESPQGPSISFFEPSIGAPGQYITIHGSGFNNFKGNSNVYFVSGQVEQGASFDFPAICLQSVWSNNQIIIKVPDGISDGENNLVIKIGNWPEIYSNQFFVVDSSAELKPSLCKISPVSGPHNAAVSLWGEYFGNNSLAIFSSSKLTNEVGVEIDGGANKIVVNVPINSITGPTKVSRGGFSGNSLNFNIGSCSQNFDCELGNTCCLPGTVGAGTCVNNINECYSAVPESSVFEWGFQTGFDINTPITNGEAYSCASYNFCPTTAWVCPNSPGFCSPYQGGQLITTGVCNNNCSDFSACGSGGVNCNYDIEIDKCILSGSNCSLPKTIQYDLGMGVGTSTVVAVCKNYNISNNSFNYNEISIDNFCPTISGVTWTMISAGKCVDVANIGDPSTCSLCSNDLACQDINNNGVCSTNRLCSGNSICNGLDCQREDAASCQCCCDKNDNNPGTGTNPACCSPLTCDYKCGISADSGASIDNFGLCSGCKISDTTDTATRDLACNCTGIYGKYCDISGQYSTGACLDCTALSKTSCLEHSSTCCWDDQANNGAGVCRGGASDEGIWGTNNTNIGYCPYYNCDNVNITMCASSNPVINGVYSKVPDCVSGCQQNCSQYNGFNDCNLAGNCCWKTSTTTPSSYKDVGTCLGGGVFSSNPSDIYYGLCKYYNCFYSTTNGNYCAPVISGTYLEENNCNNNCSSSPAGFGNSCASLISSTSCNINSCSLDCLQAGGVLGVPGLGGDCGTCCCNPSAIIDQCGLINDKLQCIANKGLCTGSERGLCCGCSSDSDCVTTGEPLFVGCSSDTCCKARPKIEEDFNKTANINVSPEHRSEDVCRNSSIEINFDQRMDSASLDNNILLLEESSGVCSPGTYFIGQADFYSGNRIAHYFRGVLIEPFKNLSKLFIKPTSASTIFNLSLLGPILNLPNIVIPPIINPPIIVPHSGPSSNKVYCATLGVVSLEHVGVDKTRAYFRPNNLLKAGTKYFVVVKGDEGLDSSKGVKSFNNIGMNGPGYFRIPGNFWEESDFGSSIVFNNVYYKNSYVWEFTTLDVNSSGQGICTIDYVMVSPSSYLFQTTNNDINENDSDPNHSTFDLIRDRDKVYVARAYSSDNQPLYPTNQYGWTWEWEISNPNVLELNNSGEVVGWDLDIDRRLVKVVSGITEGQSSVTARVSLNPGSMTNIGNGVYRTVPVYVLICNNPWPAFDINSSVWEPWKDSGSFGNYNYEFYYCRDSGSPETSDDLPAFLTDLNLTQGNSLIKTCSNVPSQICNNNSDCPAGGLCLVSFLKETYFFKARIPHFVENVNAQDLGTGGKLLVEWESEKLLVDKYKIYYSFPNNSNMQTLLINPINSCNETANTYQCSVVVDNLINNQPYVIKITAISENLAETNFSASVMKTPTESNIPNTPLNLQAQVLPNKIITLSWDAPSNYTVSQYKIYRGVNSGVYGSSFLTNNNSISVTINLSNAPSNNYYFAVSSIGSTNVESNKSNEIFVDLLNVSN